MRKAVDYSSDALVSWIRPCILGPLQQYQSYYFLVSNNINFSFVIHWLFYISYSVYNSHWNIIFSSFRLLHIHTKHSGIYAVVRVCRLRTIWIWRNHAFHLLIRSTTSSMRVSILPFQASKQISGRIEFTTRCVLGWCRCFDRILLFLPNIRILCIEIQGKSW